MLRYGHARAEAMGATIHFSQQNAECTDFADGSFDHAPGPVVRLPPLVPGLARAL